MGEEGELGPHVSATLNGFRKGGVLLHREKNQTMKIRYLILSESPLLPVYRKHEKYLKIRRGKLINQTERELNKVWCTQRHILFAL